MDSASFFNELRQQFDKKLPFVVYSRPINSVIKCWMQRDDQLHVTKTYSESGFVFAPFNSDDDTIVFPEDECAHKILEVETPLDLKPDKTFLSDVSKDSSKEVHLELLEKAIRTINAKTIDKVVLSRVEKRSLTEVDPIEIFKRLYDTYKNAMVYCWYHPKVGLWLGATPELLFKVVGRQLTTISLAGTQADRGEEQVKWSSKEIEEQQIVTDFISHQIRNHTSDISISPVETVKAGSLLHLKTRIISTIRKESNLKEVIDALHPTPAVCGFPKKNAKDFILKHENYNRTYYTGFLGELNLKHSKTRNSNRRNVENNAYLSIKRISNFYVNLRCTQIRDGKAYIYVGGGITKDSIPSKEWEETVNKTKTIVNVLR
ncbi:chorismate-binding protein [Winogradskyella poriferorum]|uniref:chorismate-binding protein n=1 Tax=Winogradskyella poriferorum TaxID=307627 RepID=UPI003D646D2C